MSAEPVPNEVVVLPPAPKVESRLPGAALAAAAAMSVAIRVTATRIMRTGAFLSSPVVPGFSRRSDLLQQLPCGVRRAGPSVQFVCRAAGSVAGAATAPHLRRSRRNVDACRTAPIRTYGLDGGCSLGRRAWTDGAG